MQDLEKLQEIEELGVDEEDTPLPQEDTSSPSGIPLAQAVLCLAALAVLLFLRYSDSPVYQDFAEWYRQEAAAEIQLPAWEESEPSPSPSPSVSPEPTPSPGPWEADASLQRI